MRMLVALLTAITVGLVVASITGSLPRSMGSVRRPRAEGRTEAMLREAGIGTSVGRFWLVMAGVAAGVYVILQALTGLTAVAMIPAAFSAVVPRWWVSRRAAARRRAIQQAWPDAIRDVMASLGAGVSLQRALEQLAGAGPVALRGVFGRFAVTVRAVGFAAALEGVREELSDPTSDRVIEVLLVAHERGGGIVLEILRDLAAATTSDLWVLEQVETESLEQRINARAVFVLPWVVLLAITLQEGPFRDFYASGAGAVVIAVGGAASAVGMVIMSRLGAQEVEPRVLGAGR